MIRNRVRLVCAVVGFACTVPAAIAANTKPASLPNIVLIYGDDVGYGDLSCYGAARARTPNIDRLAQDGLRFTDGHSSSHVCTPSRYSMMTGECAWRKKGTGILPGNARLIIDPDRATMPSVLKQAGYRTGAVGKWHLGLGREEINWNGEIKPGPLEIGFDYCFIIPATGDRVPCVYVENHRVAGLDPADPITVSYDKPVGNEPTGKAHPELLKMKLSQGHDQTIVNGISRIGYMSGGKSARWVDEDMADTITARAVQFIEENPAGKQPFFLYFATHNIHVPRVPHPRWVGKSGMGARGDAILEFDGSVGRILEAIDRLHLAENTLVILSSDNGPVLDDGYADEAVAKQGGHKPAGPLRGGKGSIYEGGNRIPFIVRWPGRVKPGVSDALVCQIDFVASFAAFTGQPLDASAGPDSMNVMPALLGDSKTGRDFLIEQGQVLALRRGPWKYILPGNGPKRSQTNTELGLEPAGQLYNLADDLGETRDLLSEQPARAREMHDALEQFRQSGRSRP